MREPRSCTRRVRATRHDTFDHDRTDDHNGTDEDHIWDCNNYCIWTDSDRVWAMWRDWMGGAYCMCLSFQLSSDFAAVLFSVFVKAI